jgi:hypothetical protein
MIFERLSGTPHAKFSAAKRDASQHPEAHEAHARWRFSRMKRSP